MIIKSVKGVGVVASALIILAGGGLFYAAKSFPSETSSGINYFKGSWVVRIRDNPKLSFNWTVKEDLQGGWLSGVVERNGEKITNDFWRAGGKKIERFAFTTGGTFVRVESPGWESNRLVLGGTMNDGAAETRIRETITRVNDRQFYALWERQDADGKWVTFADEICTR
ncbi:MAG TPA: hypothetical protein VJT09_00785 [Pyrinomonadaceae bacterium]|nr:hypothetical protein [Pyrinomonadaceae bacterium]